MIFETAYEAVERELSEELGARRKKDGKLGYLGGFYMGQSRSPTKVDMFVVEVVPGTVTHGVHRHGIDNMDHDETIFVREPQTMEKLQNLLEHIPLDMTTHVAIPLAIKYLKSEQAKDRKKALRRIVEFFMYPITGLEKK